MKTMTKTGGYSIDLVAGNIYPVFSDRYLQDTEDANYPKFFILIDNGSSTKGIAGRTVNELTFLVVAVVKQISDQDSAPSSKIEAIINDFDRLIMANDTLNGTVTDAHLSDFSTDSGSLFPEGAAVMVIKCSYYKQH